MTTWWKHPHKRDLPFLVLLTATLVCVAGFLLAQLELSQQPAGGWRRIDLPAVMSRIEAGDLQRYEAAWYHADGSASGSKAP